MDNLLDNIPENDYILLTPGPLSTTKTVKAAMLKDYCTWDDDYNNIVQDIRHNLVKLAVKNNPDDYTSILMQGSGTFSVEAVISTTVKPDDKLLVLANGAYGERIGQIASYLKIDCRVENFDERVQITPDDVENILTTDLDITYVAIVHCETTTGILNPVEDIGKIVKKYGKKYFVDAMSSFGGIEFYMDEISADFMVSSANKCIQGVPGFGFVLARKDELVMCKGNGRSLSLDLYDQWKTMEEKNGKWRYTSPTHVVRAFHLAMKELHEEGGIRSRERRYRDNHKTLVNGMRSIGFETLLSDDIMSPIITTFLYPTDDFNFNVLYEKLKKSGFVIYPGKISQADTFRIGSIGDVYPLDFERLVKSIEEAM
ncbi:MAG: 2-aminoethylphosphonate--pyruvate transaminase [Candidatus Delongbacteria bacterium]|nr:2-aminoethylphosphonate--pyruvate transaminase [Candidatus Delongbacteria bacterium]MBN2834383.1 2-aminoethylphosphonate--pyruvate transaminase [Candidatus Delongbacteria bacterium]